LQSAYIFFDAGPAPPSNRSLMSAIDPRAATASATPAAPPASDVAWTNAQIERARRVTEAAVRRLGGSDDVAREVANGGGLLLEGWTGTVSVLPIRSGQAGDAAPLLVTLDTGRELASIDADELLGLLGLASTLLAHQSAIGYGPFGTLCLHRIVQPSQAEAESLEQALRHVWHLARLLWQEPASEAGVQ
jgi:hypothetical protein